MNAFSWTDARTVDEALAALDGTTAVKAGGIDLLDLMKEGLATPSRLVNIRNIKGLDKIATTDAGALRIGPLVTLDRLSSDDDVRKRALVLAEAAGHAATPQIRNMATLGGNLLQRPRCWYFRSEQFNCLKKGGDHCFAQEGENQYHAIFGNQPCAIVHPSATATALVALRAKLEITGRSGAREVAIEEFFSTPEQDVTRENTLGVAELITAIVVPAPASGAVSAYTKLGEKESFDWPIGEVAVVLEMNGTVCRSASIVLGAVAPVPWRARGAEAALNGKTLDNATIADAARAAVAGATPLAHNGYKVAIAEALVRRTIQAAGASV